MVENVIPAGKFKDRCLALLDEVSMTGRAIVVTKRGQPVARIVPIEEPRSLIGSVGYGSDDDLMASAAKWNAEA